VRTEEAQIMGERGALLIGRGARGFFERNKWGEGG
jgi:hypothetical protein